ncbi:MAG TPA: type II secretion system secretin GspD [Syntrophales bacterium]|nr:type II secretion system secretin GspD [Syntrophales bacterium]
MPIRFGNKLTIQAALAVFVLFFVLQESAPAAKLAGNAQPVSTTSTEVSSPAKDDAAAADETPAPAPKKKAPARKKTPAKASTKSVATAPARQNPAGDDADRSVSPSATAAAAGKPGSARGQLGKYVTIDFDNVDILAFIKFISEITGKNFVVDEAVKGKVSVFSPRKISSDEAYKVFESVLEIHGLTTVPSGDVIKIVPSQQAREKNIETRLRAEALSPNDRVVTQIVPLKNANPDDMKKVLDPLVSKASVILSYPPSGMLVITDVQSNIKRLVTIINALDVPGVGEQIHIIPLRHAVASDTAASLSAIFQLDQAARRPQQTAFNMRILSDDRTNSLIVVASEVFANRVREFVALLDKDVPQGESKMHVFRLQYANSEDLSKILMNLPSKESRPAAPAAGQPAAPVIPGLRSKALLSGDVQIVSDKATNTLIITANKEDWRILEEVIRKVDVARAMVYIEALIMEVDVTKNFQLGVEWRTVSDLGSLSGFDTGRAVAYGGSGGGGIGGSYQLFPGTSTAPSFPGGFSLGVLGAGITIGGVTFPNIGAVINTVQQDASVHILSNPQLLTSDNEEATISVGKNIPYITRAERSQTNVDYTTYEYRDVGVILTITPSINTERFVRLKVNQEVSTIVQEESTQGLPTTLKRTAKTTIMIKDNQTIVIGGLMGDSSTSSNYQIPMLGDIPLLGWLFKSKGQRREKTNLYIFITPHIIETVAEAEAVKEIKREQIETFEGGVIKSYGPQKPGTTGKQVQ